METHKFSTPMMRQYVEIKREYKDCLLMYRLGDFYELFLDDAKIGSEVLDITLTSRPRGKDGKIPMAGVPYHALDSYLSRLVKAGYKVAICEQVSEPNNKGIVEREVVRVVTPGTILDENALDKKENNYLMSVAIDSSFIAISYADISTGHVYTSLVEYQDFESVLVDEVSRINPSECILSPSLYEEKYILKTLKNFPKLNIYKFEEWNSFADDPREFLKEHFMVGTLAGFDIEDKPLCIESSAALIGYLKSTQKGQIGHIKKITNTHKGDYVALDRSTVVNLELFSTIRDNDKRGTLLQVLDKTQTAMGGRKLKTWLAHPLADKKSLTARHDAVDELIENGRLKNDIQKALFDVHDIERTLSRLAVGIGNARDLIALKQSTKNMLRVKHKMVTSKSSKLQALQKRIFVKLQLLVDLIDKTILDTPSISLKDGDLIKPGVSSELDKIKSIVNDSKAYIVSLEIKERETSGISNLKVRYNQVFGYYIEISKANIHLAPTTYIRKQTLVNAERYITPELKELEEKIITAESQSKQIEYEIYTDTLSQVLGYTSILQQAADAIAETDCLVSFAQVSQNNGYVRPTLLYSGEFRVTKGRHPVVEQLLEKGRFVPNDVSLSSGKNQLLIITGPNMAGKSVFIRQVALIALMNQIGCFVPAQKANLSLVDRIFVRSGASDVITSGLSTFMVEMVETAYILNHATKNSLIVMDEIGRGTSTYDGISIAWSVADYLVSSSKLAPKTLFATHYHELQKLEIKHPSRVKNYHLEASSNQNTKEPTFLYTLKSGGASHSFGIAVAKLAGIPQSVIDNASQMLTELENAKRERHTAKRNQKAKPSVNAEILNMDINKLTPLEALNKLNALKHKLK